MRKLLFIILFIPLLSCSNDDDDDQNGVEIRLSNVSAYNYEDIVVNTSTGNVNYGDLDAAEISDYKLFSLAYRYAFIELQINGKTFTLQPIDYTGETPLKDGKYTYQIDADNSQNQYSRLTLTLIED